MAAPPATPASSLGTIVGRTDSNGNLIAQAARVLLRGTAGNLLRLKAGGSSLRRMAGMLKRHAVRCTLFRAGEVQPSGSAWGR